MNKKNSNNFINSNILYTELGTASKILMPLQMKWQPKEDITTYELALCMKYLVRYNTVMPCEIDLNDKYLRHFKITDHN